MTHHAAALTPPPTVRHPLHLLDEFLASLGCGEEGSVEETSRNVGDERLRAILRTADFLYGGSGSVLDGALSILDGGAGGQQHGIQPAVVRKVRAASSGRTVYLVQGSSTSSSRQGSPGYLCHLDDVGGKSRIGFHCSCRSYYERTKQDRYAVCKHLLAARLAPYLRFSYEDVVVSDEEFADIIIKRTIV